MNMYKEARQVDWKLRQLFSAGRQQWQCNPMELEVCYCIMNKSHQVPSLWNEQKNTHNVIHYMRRWAIKIIEIDQ